MKPVSRRQQKDRVGLLPFVVAGSARYQPANRRLPAAAYRSVKPFHSFEPI
jgi:hypothetical protein